MHPCRRWGLAAHRFGQAALVGGVLVALSPACAEELDTRSADAARANDRVPPKATVRRVELWNTYYWLTREEDFGPGSDVTLYDSDCSPLASVSQDYFENICVEGSGKLLSGEILNWDTTCSCGQTCPAHGLTVCYARLDPAVFPWGAGSKSTPLEPLRSWAVGDAFEHGSVFFVEEFEGLALPPVDGLGGTIHDGCFRADDIGVGVDGDHFDLFAGSELMYRVLASFFANKTNFTVHVDDPRCDHLQR